MTYVLSFSALKARIPLKSVGGQLKVDMTYDGLKAVIRTLLLAIPIDEDWYRREYPDVALAIDRGECSSAKQHFVDEGYFEGRLAGPVEVDEKWYLSEYDDVARGVASGDFVSARNHFYEHGLSEGRLPHRL